MTIEADFETWPEREQDLFNVTLPLIQYGLLINEQLGQKAEDEFIDCVIHALAGLGVTYDERCLAANRVWNHLDLA